MANANVDQKPDVDIKADEPEITYEERNNPWRKQPSVLKGTRFKIGDGELDPVD